MSQLPERVRHLRQAQSLTVERLAFAAGLSVSTVQRVETGKYDPSIGTLNALAQALGTSASALLSSEPVSRSAS